MTTSSALTSGERQTLEHIMDLMIPGTDLDPGAKQVGSIDYADRFMASLSEQDQKDFKMLLKLMSVPMRLLPESLQVRLLKRLEKGAGPLAVKAVMAQMFFALKAAAMTCYYSNYARPGYEGPTPWEQVGFFVPEYMIPERVLELPECEHHKRALERRLAKEQAGEATEART